MTAFVLAALLVVIAALLVERFITSRQHQSEVSALHEALLNTNRQAITAVMSRDGAHFARNEAIGQVTRERMSGLHEPREPAPMPEGL